MCLEITEIVAIDGPVGAGKSSVGRRVADMLDFAYLDTGAMYRAATWWAIHSGVNLDDSEALAAVTQKMPLETTENDGALRTGEQRRLRVLASLPERGQPGISRSAILKATGLTYNAVNVDLSALQKEGLAVSPTYGYWTKA